MEQLLVKYHESTAALYHAFDKMGGTPYGEHHHEFRYKNSYSLNESQIARMKSIAFPQTASCDFDKSINEKDVIEFRLLVAYQYNCKAAKQQIAHMKQNESCAMNPLEGMMCLFTFYLFFKLVYKFFKSFPSPTFYVL
jgi:hypothetical protein